MGAVEIFYNAICALRDAFYFDTTSSGSNLIWKKRYVLWRASTGAFAVFAVYPFTSMFSGYLFTPFSVETAAESKTDLSKLNIFAQ